MPTSHAHIPSAFAVTHWSELMHVVCPCNVQSLLFRAVMTCASLTASLRSVLAVCRFLGPRPDIAVSMLCDGISTIDGVASVNEYSNPSYLGLPNDHGMFPALFAMVFFDALAAPGRPASESRILVLRMASGAALRIQIWVRGRRGGMVTQGWVVAEGSRTCLR